MIQTFQSVLPLLAPMHDEIAFMCERMIRTLNEVCATKPSGTCKFCGTPTSDQVAGDFICMNCDSEAGACCHESGTSECSPSAV